MASRSLRVVGHLSSAYAGFLVVVVFEFELLLPLALVLELVLLEVLLDWFCCEALELPLVIELE